MKKTLIRNGAMVSDEGVIQCDISIAGDIISSLGQPGSFDHLQFDEQIDASGMLVMPGLVEPHVHFDAPFMGGTTDHDLFTGTKACAYGGITSVISFSNQAKGESLIQNVRDWEEKNEGRAYIDWSMHGLIYDASELSLAEIPLLIEEGIPTYKCFTTYKHSGRLVDDDSMLLLLNATARHGGMLMIHCEHDATCEYLTKRAVEEGHREWIYHAKTRPALAEDMAIQRIVDLMKTEPGSVYIVHASTANAPQIVAKAQAEGLPIRVETCTHYLLITEDKLKGEDGLLYICSPPLRKQEDLDALWNYTKYGPIEVVSSDDAGFPSDMRRRIAEGRFDKVPSGMSGVEPRLTLMYTYGVLENRIDLPRLVSLTSTNPARLFGLYPRKGCILPGSDADVVIFDPTISWTMGVDTLHMNADFCPFEGQQVVGKVRTLLCRGEKVIDDFELVGSPSHGRRVFRKLAQ